MTGATACPGYVQRPSHNASFRASDDESGETAVRRTDRIHRPLRSDCPNGYTYSSSYAVVAYARAGCYPEKALTTDGMLETLSHNLRREVIHYFENIEPEDTTTLEDLTAHITQRVPDQNSEGVSLRLRHEHLPKLEAKGWVDCDTRTRQVRYRGHETAEALLTELAEMLSENPYSSYSD